MARGAASARPAGCGAPSTSAKARPWGSRHSRCSASRSSAVRESFVKRSTGRSSAARRRQRAREHAARRAQRKRARCRRRAAFEVMRDPFVQARSGAFERAQAGRLGPGPTGQLEMYLTRKRSERPHMNGPAIIDADGHVVEPDPVFPRAARAVVPRWRRARGGRRGPLSFQEWRRRGLLDAGEARRARLPRASTASAVVRAGPGPGPTTRRDASPTWISIRSRRR